MSIIMYCIRESELACYKQVNKARYDKVAEDRRMKVELPDNYIAKPNTVLIMNKNNEPILTDNGDGTVSGLEFNLLSV